MPACKLIDLVLDQRDGAVGLALGSSSVVQTREDSVWSKPRTKQNLDALVCCLILLEGTAPKTSGKLAPSKGNRIPSVRGEDCLQTGAAASRLGYGSGIDVHRHPFGVGLPRLHSRQSSFCMPTHERETHTPLAPKVSHNQNPY